MTAGSGMTYSDLLAEWKHGPSCSSKTCLGCCLQTTGTLWPESFTAWPASGMASVGGLFQRPQLEHLIGATDGGASPILPTPAAADGNRGPDLARANRPQSGGMDLVTTVERLLPTPTASQPGGTAEQHLARKNKNGGKRTRVTDLGMVVGLLCSDTTQQQLSDGK